MITAQDLVHREVHYCVSSLVHTLAKSANGAIASPRGINPYLDDAISDTMHLCDQAFELATPIDDWEEAAREAGWTFNLGSHWIGPDNQRVALDAREACDMDNLESYQREVFEHWIVSDWLADKLAEKGEKVDKDFAGLTVWARTTTGQAIYMDSVIEEIAAELNAA